jgi:hypothetical protein
MKLSDVLQQVIGGNYEHFDTLLVSEHAALQAAAIAIPRLCVGKEAVLKVLQDWKSGRLTDVQVQQWASFVRRGYVRLVNSEPIKALEIDYDGPSETLIAECLGRLDEIGDQVDGVVSDVEVSKMIRSLQS